MAAPGTIRPGGRTARVAESVFAAAIAELAERDFADISIESIAERAGVHKTTVYRRWGSTPGLVVVDREKVFVLRKDERVLARLLEAEV